MIPKNTTLALALAMSAVVTVPALAQNPNYAPGDLVLAFQNPGGSVGADQTLYVSLGNAALNFRGAAAGADALNMINFLNISAQLTAAFGANWASETTLYAGLSGVWGNSSSSLNNTLQNGDPNRTLYVSQSRVGIGTLGLANSPGWNITTDSGMTAGANGMFGQNTTLEVQYTLSIAQSPTSVSTIDDQNPFNAPGDQGLAFGTFVGGVQQAGAAGSFGTFGPVANVEYALDLYRVLAKTNAPGQVGGDLRTGSYEGTILLDSAGNVSFVAVPEPSVGLFVGSMAVAVVGFARRRRP